MRNRLMAAIRDGFFSPIVDRDKTFAVSVAKVKAIFGYK